MIQLVYVHPVCRVWMLVFSVLCSILWFPYKRNYLVQFRLKPWDWINTVRTSGELSLLHQREWTTSSLQEYRQAFTSVHNYHREYNSSITADCNRTSLIFITCKHRFIYFRDLWQNFRWKDIYIYPLSFQRDCELLFTDNVLNQIIHNI